MFHLRASRNGAGRQYHAASHFEGPVYTREAFRAILAGQPEWKIRAALEEGNIPSSNVEHAIEWLEEQVSKDPSH